MTSFHCPLSYPLRSLIIIRRFFIKICCLGPQPDVDEEKEKEIRKQSFQLIKQQFEAEKEEKENSLVCLV